MNYEIADSLELSSTEVFSTTFVIQLVFLSLIVLHYWLINSFSETEHQLSKIQQLFCTNWTYIVV